EKQVYPDLREYPGAAPQRPYDVVAHTLSLQMGVDVVTVTRPFEASLIKASTIKVAPGIVEGGPAKAYVLDHASNASIRALNRLIAAKAQVYWAAKPLTVRSRTYPSGTMIV